MTSRFEMNGFPTMILLAVDDSDEATLAARAAVELCEKTGSELHVVHVGEYLPTFYAYTEEEPAELQRNAQKLLDEKTERIRDTGGRLSGIHLRFGRAAEQIVNLGEEIGVNLIVVGSRGSGGLTNQRPQRIGEHARIEFRDVRIHTHFCPHRAIAALAA